MVLNIQEASGWRGEVHSYVFDGDLAAERLIPLLDDRSQPEWSRLVLEHHAANLVTNTGRIQMTKVMVGETTLLCTYMGLTTAGTTPALADTSLTNESIVTRVALSIAQSISSYYQRYVGYFSTVSFGSTGINGEGLFDTASTGGSMWADASISVSKTTTQALVVDHRIQATS